MTRIDSHQHFWQYDQENHAWITEEMAVIQRNFSPADLQVHLQKHVIDGVVTVQVDQTEAETLALVNLAEQNDFIKGVVGWVELCKSDIEERLTFFSEFKKLKGFRHIVQAETDPRFLLNEKFIFGVKALEKFNFTYDILIYHNQLPATLDFLRHFNEQRFVIDHIGKPAIALNEMDDWKKGIQKAGRQANVYCKVSGMVTEANWKHWKKEDFHPYLDVVFDSFGPDRIMYGSDWPVCLVAATYQQQIEILEDYMASFSAEDQQKFWGKNAIDFYKL